MEALRFGDVPLLFDSLLPLGEDLVEGLRLVHLLVLLVHETRNDRARPEKVALLRHVLEAKQGVIENVDYRPGARLTSTLKTSFMDSIEA